MFAMQLNGEKRKSRLYDSRMLGEVFFLCPHLWF